MVVASHTNSHEKNEPPARAPSSILGRRDRAHSDVTAGTKNISQYGHIVILLRRYLIAEVSAAQQTTEAGDASRAGHDCSAGQQFRVDGRITRDALFQSELTTVFANIDALRVVKCKNLVNGAP